MTEPTNDFSNIREATAESEYTDETDEIMELAKDKKNLSQKLRVLKLKFAEGIYLRTQHETQHDELKFSSFLMNYTDLEGTLIMNFKETIDQDKNFINNFFATLDNQYMEGGLRQVIIFLDNFFIDIDTKGVFGSQEQYKQAGIIYYQDFQNDDADKRFVPLHYVPPKERLETSSLSWEESLKILAERLISEGLSIDYIRMDSWLIDRFDFGFQKKERQDFNPKVGLSIWGQFVTKDGELNPEAINYLLKNGKPKFNETIAKMSFVDLIYRFLPEKRGQKIELSQDSEEALAVRKEYREMRLGMEKMLAENDFLRFISLLKENRIWNYILNTEIGKILTAFLKRIKDDGITFDDIRRTEDANQFNNIATLAEQCFQSFEKENVVIMIPE